MNIQETIIGKVAVLKLSGRLVSPPDVQPFRTHIWHLIGKGTARVVVDLSEVRLLGAAMAGVLVDGLKMTHMAGGDLRLAGVAPGVMRVLMVTRLRGLFWVVETADGAVESFRERSLDDFQTARRLINRVRAATRSQIPRAYRSQALQAAV